MVIRVDIYLLCAFLRELRSVLLFFEDRLCYRVGFEESADVPRGRRDANCCLNLEPWLQLHWGKSCLA